MAFGRGPGWSPGVGDLPASSVGGDSVGNDAESDGQRPGQGWAEDGRAVPVQLRQCSNTVSLSPSLHCGL